MEIPKKKTKKTKTKLLKRSKSLGASSILTVFVFPDELVVFCPLTPFQEDVYQTLLQNPDVEMIRKKNFPCDCGSGEDRGKCCYTVREHLFIH